MSQSKPMPCVCGDEPVLRTEFTSELGSKHIVECRRCNLSAESLVDGKEFPEGLAIDGWNFHICRLIREEWDAAGRPRDPAWRTVGSV